MPDFHAFIDKINFFNKINIDEKTKKVLQMFSIFFGIIIGMTVILVTMTLLSRTSWKNGLAIEMQTVLDKYEESQYTVGKNLPVNSNLSTSSAVYSLLKKNAKSSEKYYGIIVRMPSILGPVPAVFIYTEKNKISEVKFAGYALDNGKAVDTIKLQSTSNIMNYWEKMIPQIIAKTEVN